MGVPHAASFDTERDSNLSRVDANRIVEVRGPLLFTAVLSSSRRIPLLHYSGSGGRTPGGAQQFHLTTMLRAVVYRYK